MHPTVNTGHTTHPALHLRDAADAHVVFEAVRLKIMPLIKRRLTSEERDQLTSGNVFVWEEAEHKGGLERWTDGRRWSQSRMKGEYLFYEEKVETTEEEKQAKAARRANRNSGTVVVPYTPTRRQDRPSKPDGLTKQTYSTHVYLPGSAPPRKWHIVAYFSGNDYTRLPVIENYDYLRNIRIPENIFFSSKGVVKKSDRMFSGDEEDDCHSGGSGMHDGISYGPSSPVSQYASSIEPYDYRYRSSSQQGSYPFDSRFSSAGSSSSQYYPPQSSSTGHRPSAHRALSHDSDSLPRLNAIAPLSPPPGQYSLHTSSPTSTGSSSPNAARYAPHLSSPQNYQPLTPEDRRALNTFKVVL